MNSILEIKSKIHQVVEEIPDNFLQEILDYLHEKQMQTDKKNNLFKHYDKILKEDNQLLQKLAK